MNSEANSLKNMSAADFESRVVELGKKVFDLSTQFESSFFDKGYWSGKMMEWSMNYPEFKIEMFRFVDVLPSLNDSEAIAAHIKEYFLRPELNFPTVIRAGLGIATSNSLTSKVTASAIRKNVTAMAGTFITGDSVETAKKTLEKLWNNGFCFTVDILGEAAIAENEAIHYQKKYLELIEGLSRESKNWREQSGLEEAPYGKVPRANVSVKCSSLFSQMDNMAFRHSVDSIKNRLRPILKAAVERNVFVNLDMEQNDYRNMLLTVAEEIFCEPEFEKYPHFGLVIQAYLKSALNDLDRVFAFADRRSAPLTVRLVKGAYWDYEVIQAIQRSWPIPVFLDKAETDENYEKCTEKLLGHYPKVLSAFGSHNVRSLAFAMSTAEKLGLSKSAFEIQMLFGMAEPFKRALASLGYRIREYAPVGELLPGMAYLVRRLLENTSNEGFLRAKFVGNVEAEILLKNPAEKKKSPKLKEPTMSFQNAPIRDFSINENRKALELAIARVEKSLAYNIPVVVNGELLSSAKKVEVANPSKLSQIVSQTSYATIDWAEKAVNVANSAMHTWAKKTFKARAAIVRKVADLIEAQKDDLCALLCLEVGKNFREADADVAEAIDFCRYYADEVETLTHPKSMGSSPGENNQYHYQARGVAVAIAPWNFPLAILCGMTVAPLLCGDPVIMKPAEQSPAIAFELFKILIQAGVSSDALHFVPGLGEEVGAHLVQHKLTHIVNFTGSRAVGLWILEQGAKVQKGQKHIKRIVTELGGKNALIVDDDADLDEAVVASIQSAFGFQGQKCSALSRILVHESCFEKFKARLVESVKCLKVGPAQDTSAKVGPVIDADSQKRLLDVISRNQTKIVCSLEIPSELKGKGHYVPPTVFESDDFSSELGQVEFFGPLVTLFKVKSFEEAVHAFNNVEYALTGGIFSRSPSHLAQAREQLECGNLYINRGITGALVFKQPFGGYKLSGCGAKAGGPDYLLQFLEPRTVCENTMRRGFAPEIS